MAVPSPKSEKAAMRKQARSARMKFVAGLERGSREALEARLADTLAPFIEKASIVAGYAAIGSEISPQKALDAAKAAGKTIAYPTFSRDEDTFRFRAGDPVMPGPHRIAQPADDAPEVTPDLVLVPLVAVGNGGDRLGQGKGHFDQVLGSIEQAGAVLVGIGWQMQRIDGDIPTEDWDIPVHAFCSPRGCEEF